MRLSELFEDAETSQKERQFQDAWTAARPMLQARGIPPAYYGRVQSRAHELAISYKQDVDDAISTAASELSSKVAKQQKAPTQQANPKATKKDAERYSKRTGKRWGNQYYKDPASSGGIKGAIAGNTPQALIKKGAQWVDKEVGDKMDISKALTTLNQRKRS